MAQPLFPFNIQTTSLFTPYFLLNSCATALSAEWNCIEHIATISGCLGEGKIYLEIFPEALENQAVH